MKEKRNQSYKLENQKNSENFIQEFFRNKQLCQDAVRKKKL